MKVKVGFYTYMGQKVGAVSCPHVIEGSSKRTFFFYQWVKWLINELSINPVCQIITLSEWLSHIIVVSDFVVGL